MPRPDRIEEPHDYCRQFFLAPVSECQKLVDGFGAGVTPTPFGGCAHDQISVFAKRHFCAQTINFRGRGDQNFLLLLVCQRENDFGAVNIRFDRANRTLYDQLHADRSCQVKDHVALINQLSRNGLVVNALDRVMVARMLFEVANIFNAAGGKIIDDKDFIAALYVCVG